MLPRSILGSFLVLNTNKIYKKMFVKLKKWGEGYCNIHMIFCNVKGNLNLVDFVSDSSDKENHVSCIFTLYVPLRFCLLCSGEGHRFVDY